MGIFPTHPAFLRACDAHKSAMRIIIIELASLLDVWRTRCKADSDQEKELVLRNDPFRKKSVHPPDYEQQSELIQILRVRARSLSSFATRDLFCFGYNRFTRIESRADITISANE